MDSALERVREAAKRHRTMQFTALLHHVTVERLTKAYRQLRKRAAAGVDEVTWDEYGRRLEENIQELHGRIHRGAYRPQPSRRVYIKKANGKLRALGIATVEDKIVQRAVREVLNAIYEEDFHGFCYGFREGMSQHDALDALSTALYRKKVGWVLDADIQSFFDTVGHEWMQKFLEHRIGDKRVVRLILQWLKAGVMEGGEWTESESGTPQGATISPLLANIYLYYAFDTWAHHWRRTKAKGDVVIVRYADDFVMGFEHRADAERFQLELVERLQKFGLTIHPEKTRLIEFGRYAAERRKKRGEGKPESFCFLGFVHICANEGQRYRIRRITDGTRMRRKLHEIREELERRRHEPVPTQGQWLGSVIRGFDQYHGIPGNRAALEAFRHAVFYLWRNALRRRSQQGEITVARMVRLSMRWFPRAETLHPPPTQRFDAKTLRKNRMR